MKFIETFNKRFIEALVLLHTSSPVFAALEMPAVPTGALFGADSKPSQAITWMYWVIGALAGAAALWAFVMAGSSLSHQQYGKAASAFGGGLIIALGAWLVLTVQG